MHVSNGTDYWWVGGDIQQNSVFDANINCQQHWTDGDQRYSFLSTALSMPQFNDINWYCQV